jgi:hypothetical protein
MRGKLSSNPLRIVQIVWLTRAVRARLSIWAQPMTTPTAWINRPAQNTNQETDTTAA